MTSWYEARWTVQHRRSNFLTVALLKQQWGFLQNERKGIACYDADIHYPLLLQLRKPPADDDSSTDISDSSPEWRSYQQMTISSISVFRIFRPD